LQTAGYIGGYNGRFYPTSFGSNGITLDPQGRIVWCAQGDRANIRLEQDGQERTVLADRYEGKRLNRPNDLVAKSDGWIYFTDPRSDRGGSQELDFSGVLEFNPVGCDGMKLDVKGNIYCATTSSHGIRVISPEGKHVGTILTLEDGVGIGPTNLAFGDADSKTLYITIKRSLARIRLNVAGVRATPASSRR
jgi:sugar lactone lactonase YvrE